MLRQRRSGWRKAPPNCPSMLKVNIQALQWGKTEMKDAESKVLNFLGNIGEESIP